MVGSLAGTDSYFRQGGYGGTESHFGVGSDGTTYQWQDLDYTADANLDGRYRVLSIETADYGVGFPPWDTGDAGQVPAWTDAQLDRLVHLVSWLCAQYNIPRVLIPDSKPGRRGIGFHRQGCDPYRVPGGERWSSSYGKVCPGARRVAQIPSIVARVAAGDTGTPDLPTELEDDDMQYTIVAVTGAGEPAYAMSELTFRPISAGTFAALVKAGKAKHEIVFMDRSAFDALKDLVGGTIRGVAATVDTAVADDFATVGTDTDRIQETADDIAASLV